MHQSGFQYFHLKERIKRDEQVKEEKQRQQQTVTPGITILAQHWSHVPLEPHAESIISQHNNTIKYQVITVIALVKH